MPDTLKYFQIQFSRQYYKIAISIPVLKIKKTETEKCI